MTPNRGLQWSAVGIFLFFAASLLAPGMYLLAMRESGTPAQVHVDDCETTGGSRYQTTHCTAAWVVGGSLLDGGHVVVGSVEGAEQSDVGKTLDVMLHGDTAYTRSLTAPLVLIGFGAGSALAALASVIGLVRRSRPG